ncbi:SEC14-like protein 2 [Folsomia candida]|uniref:SEC14 cytosolic factor n=1 Tax=Folsomia candida TaxID=158441 RepID=A0A226CVJ8_FOLCA|nr:SEC14-like protein 2 [Folsomia candida]OXA36929.1 SEC14 cytosolic factor [Folsomia candida]
MLLNKFLKLFLVHVFFTFCMVGDSSQENLSLTKSEKQKLDKFKKSVSTIKFPQPWMKEDLNLLRYLRARVWDSQRAKDMLTETVKWWRDYGMDNIHKEDWSKYEKEFPIYLDGVDTNGQPLFAFTFGEWDLRKAVVQGRLKGVIRWLFKRRDEVHKKVRDLQREGKINGTQWNFILNLDNFNSHQHLCAQCLQLYTEWTGTYETHYPAGADKIIIINSPASFEIVLNLVRPLFSPSTRQALKVLGPNKSEWSPILFSGIDKDQLPENFGGTRHYN